MNDGWLHSGAARIAVVIVGATVIVSCVFLSAYYLPVGRISYAPSEEAATTTVRAVVPVVTHLPTPEPLKAIYITACTAGSKDLRDKSVSLFDGTELNAIVIDLKDYTGSISYASTSLQDSREVRGCRIPDLPDFIAELHARGIYAIGRVTVFQDPFYASRHVDLAVKRKDDPAKPWHDKNGLAYIDPGARPFWDYIVNIAKEGYSIGFDEINFDYIRFPSDGNLSNMLSTWPPGDDPISASTSKPMSAKARSVRNFFAYARKELEPVGVVMSADLFGLTTSATTDMGIGQIIENAFPYFDYIAPMVYPSHFASGYAGIDKPATHPYEVIKDSMDKAVSRAVLASTSPLKIRPWLQAFDLGAKYTPEMVRAQMQATYDAGLTSWLLWNAASSYKKEYFLPASTKGISTLP